MTVEVTGAPHVPIADQATIDPLGFEHDGIVRVRLHLGFDDVQSVPEALRRAAAHASFEGVIDLDDATYFVSTTSLRLGTAHGLPGSASACISPRHDWRPTLFAPTTSRPCAP